MNSQKIYRVLVAAPLHAASGRKILNGIHRFLSEGYAWDIELVRRDSDFLRLFEDGGFDSSAFDGMVVAFAESGELRRRHANFDLPVVFLDYPDETRSALPRRAFVREDENSIASAAAKHLLSTGARASFAFVPARTATEWSKRRGAAFAAEMKAEGFAVETYCGTGDDRAALDGWIRALPKPAAVLAALDDRAIDVLESCRRIGVSAPGEVAVLGIGDDEPVCEAATPPLSSVAVDFAAQGRRAARELHALMLGGHNPRGDIRYGAPDVTVRSSTMSGKASSALAVHAMRFIRENALNGISAEDVAAHLRVSQRLARLRFRERYGRSVTSAILDIRIAEAKRLLAKTDIAVGDIAPRCGFRNVAAFRAVFERRTGLSPRAFRTGVYGVRPPSPFLSGSSSTVSIAAPRVPSEDSGTAEIASVPQGGSSAAGISSVVHPRPASGRLRRSLRPGDTPGSCPIPM